MNGAPQAARGALKMLEIAIAILLAGVAGAPPASAGGATPVAAVEAPQPTALVAVEAAEPSLESLARDARATTMAFLYKGGAQVRSGAVQVDRARVEKARRGLSELRAGVRDGLKGRELQSLRRLAERCEEQFREQGAALTPEEWSELERLYAALLFAGGERNAAIERLELAANLQPELGAKDLAGRSRMLRPLATRVLDARESRPTGRLLLPGLPATAVVQVDLAQVSRSEGPDIEIPAGQHLLRIYAEGKATWARLVVVKAGKASTIKVELKPLPGEAGRRRAQSAIVGAARAGEPIRHADASALVRAADADRAVVLSLSRGPGGALQIRGAAMNAEGRASRLSLDLAPRASLRRPLERALAAAFAELLSPR
jgi:hypothetical protein